MSMRLGLVLSLGLLAACERRDGGEDTAVAAPRAAPTGAEQVTPANAERMLRDKAMAGLRAIVPDPADARLSELRPGTAGAVCGRIDTKQTDGKRSGPRPFVVTPDGVGVISLSPTIQLNDPEDIFPDYHIRWCATTAELAGLEVAPQADNMAVPTPEQPADLPELAEAPAAPAPSAPEQTAPPTPVANSATDPGDLESFSRAVIRQPPPKD